jgi:hypothetical protein
MLPSTWLKLSEVLGPLEDDTPTALDEIVADEAPPPCEAGASEDPAAEESSKTAELSCSEAELSPCEPAEAADEPADSSPQPAAASSINAARERAENFLATDNFIFVFPP